MYKFPQAFVATLVATSWLLTGQPQHAALAQAEDILRVSSVSSTSAQGARANSPAPAGAAPRATLSPEQVQALLQELQSQQAKAQSAGRLEQPTSQPESLVGAQIPEPIQAKPERPQAQPNKPDGATDKQDDGSYNEAGTEMEGAGEDSEGGQAAAAGASGTQAAPATAQSPTFEVNWNKCPQLEPNESERGKKTQVITKCLQMAPIPTNLTRENVEAHREQIATCALKSEGWFDEAGNYRYDKAESEIRVKKLEASIELQVLKFHMACKDEANNKFPRDQKRLIDQVQFYQACMDYYISIVCEIEVSVDQ